MLRWGVLMGMCGILAVLSCGKVTESARGEPRSTTEGGSGGTGSTLASGGASTDSTVTATAGSGGSDVAEAAVGGTRSIDDCEPHRDGACSFYRQCDGDRLYGHCEQIGGELQCTCSDKSWFYFTVAPEYETALCDSIQEYCPLGSVVRGESECEVEYLETSNDYCAVDLNCTSPAVVNDTPISLVDYASLYCDANGDGSWDCGCDSGQEVEVEADNADAACLGAIDRCTFRFAF